MFQAFYLLKLVSLSIIGLETTITVRYMYCTSTDAESVATPRCRPAVLPPGAGLQLPEPPDFAGPHLQSIVPHLICLPHLFSSFPTTASLLPPTPEELHRLSTDTSSCDIDLLVFLAIHGRHSNLLDHPQSCSPITDPQTHTPIEFYTCRPGAATRIASLALHSKIEPPSHSEASAAHVIKS